MQRKDVERMVDDCILASKVLYDTGTFETGQTILREAAAALSALLAERDALQGQLNDLRNGWANSVKAHAALLAERDAAFAAGQEEMRGRAAEAVRPDGYRTLYEDDALLERAKQAIRALPIKPYHGDKEGMK